VEDSDKVGWGEKKREVVTLAPRVQDVRFDTNATLGTRKKER